MCRYRCFRISHPRFSTNGINTERATGESVDLPSSTLDLLNLRQHLESKLSSLGQPNGSRSCRVFSNSRRAFPGKPTPLPRPFWLVSLTSSPAIQYLQRSIQRGYHAFQSQNLLPLRPRIRSIIRLWCKLI